MIGNWHKPPSFWRTVRLLLGAARKRAGGRRRRQEELLGRRGGTAIWSELGFLIAILFMAVLNIGGAFAVRAAVKAGEYIELQRSGKIVVSRSFMYGLRSAQDVAAATGASTDENVSSGFYESEADKIVEDYGGSKTEIARDLRTKIQQNRIEDLVTKDHAFTGFTSFLNNRYSAMLASFVLLWWVAMVVCQGEGLELDLQRRRHPMWEWLLSHPVPPGAVFLADMLSPIAANPIYWSAPLFTGILFGFVYDAGYGALAVFLVGVPVTIAAACLGKALEIGVTLRFPMRTRGAIIGMMGWFGYASAMILFIGAFAASRVLTTLGRHLTNLTAIPWPWLQIFLGGDSTGAFSFLQAVLTGWAISAIVIAAAVGFSVWGTQQGLTGSLSATDISPSRKPGRNAHFGKDPLYRKEFLWFVRDRSAIVQVILIPLTAASIQVFNLRGILSQAQGAWNYLCGVAILFGTYFLWILGPKSLASEGTALWIALTWPRGMESLLKAKAWLWSLISSGIVALVLLYAAYTFPRNIWQIMLVGIGWFFFGRSMAEKTVTLVTVVSSSGEREPIPWTRRGAAQLGMLTFCIGVLTQQWHVAVMGIVYSYITAAAMWQNFRARLPYLYDPWSEKLPLPPTLMHAMVAISLLVEAGAVVTGIIIAFAGRENIAVAQAIGYGICATVVSVGMSIFLSDRGVVGTDVWYWKVESNADLKSAWGCLRTLDGQFLSHIFFGVLAGVFLGLFAQGYMEALRHFGPTAEILRKSQEQMAKIPDLRISYAVMAVLFAPFAEEYLFRGLLYRALDREWGGWKAIFGSAAFFAVYHSPLAWLPVGLLGVANALLFKKTGRLVPAVVLHMVYNAVVLAFT